MLTEGEQQLLRDLESANNLNQSGQTKLAELRARAGPATQAGTAPQAAAPVRPMSTAIGMPFSALQGATLDWADEAAAGINALEGGDYAAKRAEIEAAHKAWSEQNPGKDLGARLAGGLMPLSLGVRGAKALASVPNWIKAPAAGAAAGAVAGAGAAQPGEREAGAAVGGATGLGASILTTAALAGLRGAVSGATSLAGRLRGDKSPATRKVARAFAEDGISLDEARQTVRDLGPDAVLADAGGPNVIGQAWRTAAQPGPGKTVAKRVLDERDLLQAERILAPVEASLGKGSETYATLADRMARRSEQGRALYGAAYKVPIERLPDPVKQVLATPAGARAWRKAAAAAANDTDWPAAKIPPLADVLSGKVVPDMRTLDYVYGALEDGIRPHRNPISGKLETREGVILERGARKLVAALDEINPSYREARAVWRGETRDAQALERGLKFMNRPHELTASDLQALSASEQEMFRLGAARAIQDMVDRAGDTHDVTRRVFGNKRIRDTLRSVWPDEESWGEFERVVKQEATKRRTRNAVQGNSLTEERRAIQAEQGADTLAGPALSLAMGRPGEALQGLTSRAVNALRRSRMSPEESAELAELLYSTDPMAQQRAFARLGQPVAATRLMGLLKNAAVPAGVGAGALSGLLMGR